MWRTRDAMTAPRRLRVPEPAAVVLAGPAGCGKSTFAERHFPPEAVLSSDAFRALVAGDPGDQTATSAAFGLMRHALEERMKRRRLTVLDATSITPRERVRFVDVAHRHDVACIAVAFDLPLEVCQQRSTQRRERQVPPDVVERQHRTFRRHLGGLHEELFDQVVVLGSSDDLDAVEVVLDPELRPRASTPSTGLPPAVIIDLDGTLTSAAWREHFLSGRHRDWPGFFAGMGRDAPVQPLVDLVAWASTHATVVLLTGRPDDHATVIRRWLADHGVVYDRLLMRPGGDRRPDTVVKREIYHRDVAPHHDVRFVIDDRPRVVDMWREEGLYVLTAVDPRLDPLDEPTG